jgi:phenylalanyl-tRNA synthetase beta chain
MKYSYNWLQKHIQEKLPAVESLKETIIFHAFEVESVETVGDDTILDIKVLPDRAHDCLSHYGMAREIAGLCKLTLKPLEFTSLPASDLDIKVEVESDLCRRYIAIKIDGVIVAPSPEWLKTALESVGQKSINNVVDATNYVLLDRGQPVHAFDSANVDGGIVVRLAKEGEKIITLSGEEKELKPDMLVIADYIGPLAIAGIKGGKSAEVTSTTTSIIVEIANFDPILVRKAARALGLATDASKRFENNLSPVVAFDAAQQIATLIQELAGGTVTGVYEHFPHKPQQQSITCTTQDIARILGSQVAGDMIEEVYVRYGYKYKREGDKFTLTVPYERLDLTGSHDIAEEIGRVIGYDTIPSSSLPMVLPIVHAPQYLAARAAKAWLVHDGFTEVQTYTFTKKGQVYVARGPKDKSALRTNLSDGLKASYEMNRLNAPLWGASTVKLFEIGSVFVGGQEKMHVATIDEKGRVTETTLDAYITEHSIVTDPVSLEHEISTDRFVMWSVYPFIVRDVAVWVPDAAGEESLASIVQSFAREHKIKQPVCFDRFTKDDKTSVAYRFVFQSMDHTLTEDEIAPLWEKLASLITQAGFAIR